jgi:predicted nucleotidyltransferase
MTEQLKNELEIIKAGVLSVIPNTETIYLFGSHANGIPNADSDLDIYVVIPDSVEMHPLDVGGKIRLKLYKKRTMPLDLLIGRAEVFNRRKEGLTFENTVWQEGIKIYEQQ